MSFCMRLFEDVASSSRLIIIIVSFNATQYMNVFCLQLVLNVASCVGHLCYWQINQIKYQPIDFDQILLCSTDGSENVKIKTERAHCCLASSDEK